MAEHLLEKRDFSYALFFGHLAVEKLLKAMYVAFKREHAPPIHNLVRPARSAEISLDESRTEWSDVDIAVVSPDFSEDLFEERIMLMKIAIGIDDRLGRKGFSFLIALPRTRSRRGGRTIAWRNG